MKKIAILGSTGSIGTQSLDVIRRFPDKFKVVSMTCGKNTELFRKQLKEFRPLVAVTADRDDAEALERELSPELSGTRFAWGEEGLIAAATLAEADIVLNSLMGMRGLVPTYHAIESGKDIALANKETLVAGGELVMNLAGEKGVRLLPVDSEHSAIFQCLEGNRDKKIRRILLTASGGPFRGYTYEDLRGVTAAQALKHPNWSMGKKITIDSATMMNKGLEVIEARWLFDVPSEDIQVLVHPQSIVHSAVEFEDTSILAQMGLPDMRVPISVALGYPDRLDFGGRSLNLFTDFKALTFEEPDPEVFRCLKLAFEALKEGGSYTAYMNGANEILVERFLRGEISFTDIGEKLEKLLENHDPIYNLSLDNVVETDRLSREDAKRA
jgi:1-deoxy-D-xylulose-5-phosphate reductoisomerase